MSRVFMKGCEAIAEAAVRAGCRFFAGYPITPQSEIPEYFSRRLPEVKGVFIQGESEVASINMLFGAGGSGTRSMTSSSSCGISLKSEGISYIAAARIPVVISSVMRGGPGVGSTLPSQQDYLQAVKAMGNGGFRSIVLAPATVQEAVDLTYLAFELADQYRNPTVVLSDGVTATMMEPVELPRMLSDEEIAKIKADKSSWCMTGKPEDRAKNFINPGATMAKNKEAAEMYEKWEPEEVRVEEYMIEDADVIVTAYGFSARIAKGVVDMLRARGYKVGLIRPITVYPFPYESFKKLDYDRVRAIIDVEMSIPAQMIEDVRLGVLERAPIYTCLTSAGVLMNVEHLTETIEHVYEKLGGM